MKFLLQKRGTFEFRFEHMRWLKNGAMGISVFVTFRRSSIHAPDHRGCLGYAYFSDYTLDYLQKLGPKPFFWDMEEQLYFVAGENLYIVCLLRLI